LKTPILPAAQTPSQGIEPSWSRPRMPAAWARTSS